MSANGTRFANELAEQGFCIVPNVLDATMLRLLQKRFSDNSLAETSKENFGDSGAFVIADYNDPVMVDLLTWPKTLEMLSSVYFAKPKLHNFYVSTKPPKAEALAWHSDLFYKYEEPAPAELFLIYYLQDTSPKNGCLRVVPASHKWSHAKRHAQPENAEYRHDEVDVPIKAGDLFIGDRRIMHATHANSSDSWRTCLTIAYAPLYEQLDEQIQALIVTNRCLPRQQLIQDHPSDLDSKLLNILPLYNGAAKPIPTDS